jgi:hypothetical protein
MDSVSKLCGDVTDHASPPPLDRLNLVMVLLVVAVPEDDPMGIRRMRVEATLHILADDFVEVYSSTPP